VRVDADISGLEAKEEDDSSISQEEMQALFRKATGLDTLEVKLQPLQDEQLNALLTEDEQMRRFADMNALYGRDLGLQQKQTLVVNPRSSTVQDLVQVKDEEKKELIAAQIYDLARLATRPLEKDDLRRFLKRSQDLVAALAKKQEEKE
jgi:molecular chaperone HtpG